MRSMLVFMDGGATYLYRPQYVYGYAGTHGMHVVGGAGMVAKRCMPPCSGRSTNLYIKVCMVCEVCLFSWAGGGLFIVLASTIIMRHVLLLLVSVAHIL